jgi:hypothetical protein
MVEVGNRETRTNPHPVTANVSTHFACSPPESLLLYPVEDVAGAFHRSRMTLAA